MCHMTDKTYFYLSFLLNTDLGLLAFLLLDAHTTNNKGEKNE